MDTGENGNPNPNHTPVISLPWLGNPNFVEDILLALELPQALPDPPSRRKTMRKLTSLRKLSRRDFLKLGGGLLAGAAATRIIPKSPGQSGEVALAAGLLQISNPDPDIHLLASDGWIHLPGRVQIARTIEDQRKQSFNPAVQAPDFDPLDLESGLTTYIVGFRDVTGMSETMMQAQKMKVQASAPLLWVDQEQDYFLALSNFGRQMRPDLMDSHTVYWHGFSNADPIFAGEPHSYLAVPIGRTLTLHYKPHNPGTYMYHCHFEEAEHVHMGMTGTVFVRPNQDGNTSFYPSGKYTYNDGDGSTGFDREYAITLTDVWEEAHWADAQIQLPDWPDIMPEYFLLNGRVYPDTLVGNGGEHVGNLWGHDAASGDLLSPPNRPDLRYQPISSLIEANAGDRILLRFANLSFQQHAMTMAGLKMKVVGRDATLLRGRNGTDLTYETNTVHIGIGESYDVIITAPNVTIETKFLLYNRNRSRLKNSGGMGYGGQMTEVRIHPAGTMAQQTVPNTNPRTYA